jgi:hypothetical protein
MSALDILLKKKAKEGDRKAEALLRVRSSRREEESSPGEGAVLES